MAKLTSCMYVLDLCIRRRRLWVGHSRGTDLIHREARQAKTRCDERAQPAHLWPRVRRLLEPARAQRAMEVSISVRSQSEAASRSFLAARCLRRTSSSSIESHLVCTGVPSLRPSPPRPRKGRGSRSSKVASFTTVSSGTMAFLILMKGSFYGTP